jgi:hypothetical protein
MANEPSAEVSTNRYGPLSFVSGLLNILVLNSVLWFLFIFSFWGYEVLLPLLLVDLVMSAGLNVLSGPFGRIGRGMLIGWISAPVSLLIFGTGFALASVAGI